MTISKDAWIRFIYTAVISTIIYLFSSIVIFNESLSITNLVNSIGLGLFIWFISENLFEVSKNIWPHSDILSYLLLVVFIGLGTGIGLFLFDITDFIIILIICITAITLGLSIVIYHQYKYKEKVNTKLQSFKENH